MMSRRGTRRKDAQHGRATEPHRIVHKCVTLYICYLATSNRFP
jgi:hypothetical protein